VQTDVSKGVTYLPISKGWCFCGGAKILDEGFQFALRSRDNILLTLLPIPAHAKLLSTSSHKGVILFALAMIPVLRNGRRRTKLDRKYNGPPRQGPVRHISPAQLNLERVYEQNRLSSQKRDTSKVVEPAPGPAAKGKPRLLLMGQRR